MADERLKARQTRELIKATDDLIKSQEELLKLASLKAKSDATFDKARADRINAMITKKEEQARKEISASQSSISLEEANAKQLQELQDVAEEGNVAQKGLNSVVSKTIQSMEAQSQSFIDNIPFLKDFGETLADPGKKNFLLFSAGMAAGAVEMVRLTKNLLDLNAIAPLAFGSFSEGLIGTAEIMFDTGLSASELKDVFKEFPGTFRKFKTQIGDVADANEDLIFSLGLSREEFTKQTVQAIALADAMGRGEVSQEELNRTARDYVVELNALAVQTGRQADEIEAQRAGAVQSMALFLTTLPEDVRAGFVGGIAEINRQTPQLLEQISGIFQTVDPGEAIQKANDFSIATRAMTEGMDDSKGVVDKFLNIQAAAAAGNEEARKAFGPAAKDFAEFMAKNAVNFKQQNAALVGSTPGVQAAAEALASMSNDISGLASATGQTREQMLENADATRRQAGIVKDATDDLGFFGEILLDGSKLLSVFGTDLTNIGVFLFGLSKVIPIITGLFASGGVLATAITFIGGALATIGTAIAGVASAIALPVIAIVALGVGLFFLIKHFDTVSEVLQGMADSIGIWIDEWFDAFMQMVPGMIEFLKGMFGTLIEVFTFLPKQILGLIVGLLPDGVKEFIDFLIGAARAVLPDFVANALFGEREDEGATETATTEQEKGEAVGEGIVDAIANFFKAEEREPGAVIGGGRGRARPTQGQVNARLGVTAGGVNFVGPPGAAAQPVAAVANQGFRGQKIDETDLDFLDRKGEEAKEKRRERHRERVASDTKRIADAAEVQIQLQDKAAVSAEKTERNTNPAAPRRGGRGHATG